MRVAILSNSDKSISTLRIVEGLKAVMVQIETEVEGGRFVDLVGSHSTYAAAEAALQIRLDALVRGGSTLIGSID
jgi:hypothetical protein